MMIFSKKIIQFLAVAQYGSLTKASSAINTTPSAISQGIHNLEFSIGRKLLHKTRSGMSLTDTGKRFYTQIKPCFDEACKIIDKIKIDNEKNLSLKMDGFHYPSIQCNLDKFLLENESYNLNISCDVVLDVHSELINGESDIVISPSNFNVTDSRIQKISLPPERIGILLTKEIIDKHKGNVNKVLQNEKLINTKNVLEHSIVTSLIDKLKDFKFTKKIMKMSEIDTLYLLSKGIGFTLSTEILAEFHAKKNNQLHFIKKPFGQDIFLHRKAYFLTDNIKKPHDILNLMIKK